MTNKLVQGNDIVAAPPIFASREVCAVYGGNYEETSH